MRTQSFLVQETVFKLLDLSFSENIGDLFYKKPRDYISIQNQWIYYLFIFSSFYLDLDIRVDTGIFLYLSFSWHVTFIYSTFSSFQGQYVLSFLPLLHRWCQMSNWYAACAVSFSNAVVNFLFNLISKTEFCFIENLWLVVHSMQGGSRTVRNFLGQHIALYTL